MKYAVETKGGQKICLNFEDDCLFQAGANTSRLQQNGATVADFVSRDRAANNLALINAPAGAAPSVTATGPEADIPLDLQAKGKGVVRILSKMTMAKLSGAGIVVADSEGDLSTVNETVASSGGSPSLSGCGEDASLDESSSNRAGSFTTGWNNSSTCTLIFAKAWKSAAFCTVTPANAVAANLRFFISAQSAASFTTGFPPGAKRAKFKYVCGGD